MEYGNPEVTRRGGGQAGQQLDPTTSSESLKEKKGRLPTNGEETLKPSASEWGRGSLVEYWARILRKGVCRGSQKVGPIE